MKLVLEIASVQLEKMIETAVTKALKSQKSSKLKDKKYITQRVHTNSKPAWKSGLWKSGTWEYGIWEYGIWKSGTWESGTWKSGTWKNGTWKSGTWKYGLWKSGTWKSGFWETGLWKSGTWESGWIYDPKKIGNFKADWEWRENYIKSPISPKEYFKYN